MSRAKNNDSPFISVTTIFLFVLVTVFLLNCGTDGYQDIQTAKFQSFCVICGGYILVMAILSVERVVIGTAAYVSPVVLLCRASWAQKFSLIYLGLTWASAVFSPYFPETVIGVSRCEGALSISLYVICFLLVSVYGRVSGRLLYVVGVSITILDCLCVLQLMGYNPLVLYPNGYSYTDAYQKYAGAYLGTIGNVDLVASFFCIVIPILWIGLLRLTDKHRILLIIPLAVSLFVLLKMWVLAGVVGVVVGGIGSFLVVAPLSSRTRKKLSLVIFILAIAALVTTYLIDPRSGFLHELHEMLHGNWNASFGSGRIHIWENVLSVVPEHLLLGAGPDTMLYAELEPFTRYHEAIGGMIVTQIDVAHNEYLNILYHQGILALFAYLVVLLALMKQWIEQHSQPVVAMLGGAAFCYCVQAFFGFSMCITAPFFWTVLGLLEGYGRRSKEESTGGREKCGRKLQA